MTGMARLGGAVRRVGLGLILAVSLGTGVGVLVGGPAFASGETGGSPTGTGTSPTNSAAGVWCSTLDRRAPISAGEPVMLTTGVGSTQSATAGTPFSIRLAVTVTDAEKNPVAGVQVTFSTPTRGASGRFTVHSPGLHDHRARVSHLYIVEVKTNACGIALAPAFTADDLPGGYIVKASAKHVRPAAFALVNIAPGQSE